MKAVEIFLEAKKNKNNGMCSSSSANGLKTHTRTSGGTTVTGNKSVTKMKSLKKRIIQAHDSDSEADEYWVTYMNCRGWI